MESAERTLMIIDFLVRTGVAIHEFEPVNEPTRQGLLHRLQFTRATQTIFIGRNPAHKGSRPFVQSIGYKLNQSI